MPGGTRDDSGHPGDQDVDRVGQDAGFGTERNTVTVLDRHGVIVNEVSGSKMSVANCILDLIG